MKKFLLILFIIPTIFLNAQDSLFARTENDVHSTIDLDSPIIGKIQKGEGIIPIVDFGLFLKINYRDQQGFVWADYYGDKEKVYDPERTLKQIELNKKEASRKDSLRQVEFLKKQEEQKKNLIKKFGKKEGTKIANGEVWVGMTDLKALHSWGEPERKNKTTNSRGTSEQWVYSDGSYLYFENGRLTTIQTSE